MNKVLQNNISLIMLIGLLMLPVLYFSQQRFPAKKVTPIPMHMGPVCDFSVLNNCYGDTVYFINHTINLQSPFWEIADSNNLILFSSVDTNIRFLFPVKGNYFVKLKADNGHPDSIIKTIDIGNGTKADFDFQQCSQQFINNSSCADSFYWNFGDGNFSANPHPIHYYADTGMYSVLLVVSKAGTIDSITKVVHVYSKGIPSGNFTYIQSNDTVYFFGDTLADNFNWNFGDGNSSSLKNPAHVYASPGNYLVSVSVNNYCDTRFYNEQISVGAMSILTYFSEYKSFNVYPNPVKDKIQFSISNVNSVLYSVSLMSISGKKIEIDYRINDSIIQINNNISPGQYLLILQLSTGNYVSKITVY